MINKVIESTEETVVVKNFRSLALKAKNRRKILKDSRKSLIANNRQVFKEFKYIKHEHYNNRLVDFWEIVSYKKLRFEIYIHEPGTLVVKEVKVTVRQIKSL